MTALIADDRWVGQHGIGRYAREVLSRLDLEWAPIASRRSPASPLSIFDRVVSSDGRAGDLFYSPGYNGAAFFAGRQVVTVHDLIHLETSWPGRAKYLAYYNGFLRPLIRRNKVVLTVSETSRRAISRWLRDDRVDIVVTGNGCSEDFAPTGPIHSEEFPYYLYVGNLRAHKNVDTALAALRGMDDAHLLAVVADGDGLKRLAATHGVSARVHQVRGLSDEQLASYYRGAIATLMPSTLEGFGLPALESVASGTPVVYWSGCESVREIVQDDGIAVSSPTDTVEWVSAMRSVRGHVVSHSRSLSTWADVETRVAATLGAIRA